MLVTINLAASRTSPDIVALCDQNRCKTFRELALGGQTLQKDWVFVLVLLVFVVWRVRRSRDSEEGQVPPVLSLDLEWLPSVG